VTLKLTNATFALTLTAVLDDALKEAREGFYTFKDGKIRVAPK
jgi:hypothetical protein